MQAGNLPKVLENLIENLTHCSQAFANGERNASVLKQLITDEIQASGGRIDYVECVDARTLQATPNVITRRTLVAVAVRYGEVRLIDNCILEE